MDVSTQQAQTDIRFSLSDKIPLNECSSYMDALIGNWDNTVLSCAFFCANNIQIIQNGLRYGVFSKSNGQYIVAEQSCDQLKIIMRSIFLQYSKNQDTNITTQIADLNTKVIHYAVSQVLGEAEGYIKYMRDINTPLIPNARPILSYTNDKTLEFKRWFD